MSKTNSTSSSDAESPRPPELGCRLLAGPVTGWADALAAAAPGADDRAAFMALLEAATEKAWRHLGLGDGAPPRPTGFDVAPSAEPLLSRAHALVEEAPLPEDLWREPHLLGWLVQHWAAPARAASFAAHTAHEHKHADALATTQLYTPRWIADLLADHALRARCSAASDAPPPRVFDPAVGGGQMLLAALDAILARRPRLRATQVAALLAGRDLDPRAVAAGRLALKVALAVRFGAEEGRAAWPVVDRQIVVGDGLDPGLDPATGFDVVLANPPYMGSRSMPPPLRQRLKADFPDFHHDLYLAFLSRCQQLCCPGGAVGALAQQGVWFLGRFASARRALLAAGPLELFVHLGAGAFPGLSGEKASVVAFVQRVDRPPPSGAAVREAPEVDDGGEAAEILFVDLRQERGAEGKEEAWRQQRAPSRRRRVADFEVIPGAPLAHDLDEALLAWFGRPEAVALGELCDIPGGQNKTGNNRRYVRRFDEVDPAQIRCAPDIFDGGHPEGRWVFLSKGGPHCPWWGNWRWVVDWSEEARAFYRDNRNSNLLAQRYWFREGICYTDFAGRRFNARWMPPGCVFDMTGPAIFPHPPAGVDDQAQARWRQRLWALLALLNASTTRALLNAMNPSLHYQVRDLRRLPVPLQALETHEATLAQQARRLVDLHRQRDSLDDATPTLASSPPVAPDIDRITRQIGQISQSLDRAVAALYHPSLEQRSSNQP